MKNFSSVYLGSLNDRRGLGFELLVLRTVMIETHFQGYRYFQYICLLLTFTAFQ